MIILHLVCRARRALPVTLVAAAALLGGCADPGTTDGGGQVLEPRVSRDSVAAPLSAVATIRAGGTFDFVLDESDPGPKLRAGCAAASDGDLAKEAACNAENGAEAAGEGIRFSRGDDGSLVWTSWAVEDGAERVCIRAPLAVAREEGRVVVTHVAGEPEGWQVSPSWSPSRKMELRFEVVDAKTVVMLDAEKGRLVFHRREG